MRRAPATLAIVALTSAVVVAQLAAPSLVTALGASWPEIAHGQVWRLVTGSLVHGLGVAQLVVNMAAFIVFGPPLERAIGRRRFVALYFGGGALVWLLVLTITDRAFTGAGASASVFAVMAAGVPVGLRQPGGRWGWAALSAAAVVAGLVLGVLLVPVFGRDVLVAHVYGTAIGLVAGALATPRSGATVRA
jgi:membrane associated rhomboid family serine protease